jgi:cytidine deaminase
MKGIVVTLSSGEASKKNLKFWQIKLSLELAYTNGNGWGKVLSDACDLFDKVMFMSKISNEELVKKANSVIKPRKIKHGFSVGDVGCALVTDKGNIYLGVSIDAAGGMGFCAEHSAIAAMVTNGEHVIKKIVAVVEDGKPIPPCGRCREFMHQIHEKNLEAEVIIGKNKAVRLKELLPYPWDAER